MRKLIGILALVLTLLAVVQLGSVQAVVPVASGFQQYLPIVEKPLPPTSTPEPTATLIPTALPTAQPTAVPTPAQTCAPEYPTVCIPPPPPDLDCADISYRRFTVLPPDRHQFDTDRDGIGCESGSAVIARHPPDDAAAPPERHETSGGAVFG